MNGLERCGATLQGESVDRRFVVLGLSLYGARLTGCPLAKYYTDPVEYVRGQQAVLETFGHDLCISPFCLTAEGEAFGCAIRSFDRQPPVLLRPALDDPKKISTLEIPDVDRHPRLQYIRETVRLQAAAHNGVRPVAAIISSPLDLPPFLIGGEAWLEALLFDPDLVSAVLDLTIPFFVRWANSLFADGAMVALLPMVFFNPLIVSDKVTASIAVPAMQKAFSQLKGPVILHHGGSPVMRALPYCSEIPNVMGYVLDQRDDICKARECVGEKPTLFSGMAGAMLDQYTPEEVRAFHTNLLHAVADDSRFAIATTTADIPFCTPSETIHAVLGAVKTFAESREHA